MPFTKKHTMVTLLVVAIIAVIIVPAALYWHSLRPWQHVVNLDYVYQAKIAAASPHDPNPRNNLAQLPAGYQIFDNVRFKVAGLIQLADGNDVTRTNNPYPPSVENISVNQLCHQLHILHGTVRGVDNQTVVGSLVLHYTDGTVGKLNIVYGQQVYDWWFRGADDLSLAGNSKIAWMGDNPEATREKYRIRVFKTSFANPKPDVRIDTVDFVSALTPSAPFLLALTVE